MPTEKPIGERLLTVLFFTLILSVMNVMMFNIALPEIKAEFDVPSSVVGWVLSGYIVVYAVGSVTYGKLADLFPLRRLLFFGLLVVALGSLFGLFAQSFWMVMVGRILQSVGASVIPAVAMLVPVRYFPVERRGRALGMISTGLATGTALGPIVAGFVVETIGWRMLFLLPLLLLLTLPFYYRWLGAGERGQGKFDILGGSLLALTVVLLLLAVTRSAGWLALFGGVVGFILLWHTRRAREPFLTPTLFANARYRTMVLLSFVTTSTTFVVPFLMPLLLSDVHSMTPAQIGLILFPGALLAALLGRTVGRWTDEFGSRMIYLIATASLAVVFIAMAIWLAIGAWVILPLLLIAGVAHVGLQISLSKKVSATLPSETAGLGMGMFMMLNFISGATATTLVSKSLDMAGSGEAAHYSAILWAVAAILLAVLLAYRLSAAKSDS
jgi:DHA2 family metal-tetracycline-proton antiporter-like MFS transporter